MATGKQQVSTVPPPAPSRVLGADDKPLVWIDCECVPGSDALALTPQDDRA